MYKPKHFTIEELVPPQLLDLVEEDVAWKMFDEELLRAIDWVKETYSPNDPVTINNWKWGGNFTQSGLRTKDWEHYNPKSTHPYGEAVDMKFKNITAEDIRQDLKERGKDVPYITECEEDVSWLHISTGKRYNHLRPEGGVIFYPA
jgi:hypothetical protein